MRELQYAIRGLRRSPMVAGVAVLSLALGMGASTGIFSVANAVLVRALPVARPAELVVLQHLSKKGNIFDSFSYSDYLALRDVPGVLTGLAAVAPGEVNLASDQAMERVPVEVVSGNYFPLLGVDARTGRLIGPEDDQQAGAHPVCVVSYSLWERRFGSAPDIAGHRIQVNGRPYTILGVTAQTFHGTEQGREAQLYIPLMMSAEVFNRPSDTTVQPPFLKWNDWLKCLGRRLPGVSTARAQAALDARFDRTETAHRETTFESSNRHGPTGTRGRLVLMNGRQGFDNISFRYQRPLWILLALVGLLLSIACANVANLLLARMSGRRKEIAIRVALGGGPWRLVRQLMTESAVLAGAGAAGGLLLSFFISDLLLRSAFLNDTRIDAKPDLAVFGFLLAVSAFTALLFGLAPAIGAARTAVAPILKSASAGGGRRRTAMGSVMVVAQVALSVMLLAGSGLLLRSLTNLQSIQPGFQPRNVLLASLNPGANHYTEEQARTLYTTLMERAEAIPGVQSVSATLVSPLSGSLWLYSVEVPGFQHAKSDVPLAYFNGVGPGYFASIGAKLKSGREFTRQDRAGAPLVAVVNELMAQKYWPGKDPVGQRFQCSFFDTSWIEVVGVVRDSVYRDLRETKQPVLYVPLLQGDFRSATLDLRVIGDPAPVFAKLSAISRQVDATVPLYNLRTLAAQIAGTLSPEHLLAVVSTLFACLALLLAVAGLYGLMAYRVTQRSREIAIRMALGAVQGRVVYMVMREGVVLVTAGLVVGIPLSLLLSRWIATFLYGLQPGDPATYGVIVAILLAASLAATLAPSRRASRVDPVVSLRWE